MNSLQYEKRLLRLRLDNIANDHRMPETKLMETGRTAIAALEQQMHARSVDTVIRNSQWLTVSEIAELINRNHSDPKKVITNGK